MLENNMNSFPLEVYIRQFKNRFPDNSYNIAIFDSCREVVGKVSEPSREIVGRMMGFEV